VKNEDRIHNLSKGVDSLSRDEHGLFFDAVQRLGLSNEVKQAAVALYLDVKSRPIGEYNASRKNLEIFLIATISLAAKTMGDPRTDHEFESKMFVNREKLVDAEERIIMSLGVQDSMMPLPDLVLQLARRQIETMAEGFAQRGLVSSNEREELVQRSYDYLNMAMKRGLNPKMSYRGRAAGVLLNAVRDMGLRVSEIDVATASGFDKRLMEVNTTLIAALLKDPSGSSRKQT
jgi:hypothetical protein